MIKKDSVVSFEYTLSDESGAVIESNKGEAPVTYTHGEEEIIPALEKALSVMGISEKKNIRLGPKDAYGPVDPEGFKEVPRKHIPAEGLKTGTMLRVRGPHGEDVAFRVHEIKEESVVLDLNHPLAGKTLTFDVKILDVQPGDSE
ncbi:MAG TPA: FKBP-type peptidyl-prolyl cis-trans isomerase [Candidatus Binatia bacterium]|jgi:FKBP-type peptidyl-prolyl cis-trans isomerase SlyD|nr:FKBP-type peptidyl-prolyl cis-trans isomerase [Candidatus Binatia bacterium]